MLNVFCFGVSSFSSKIYVFFILFFYLITQKLLGSAFTMFDEAFPLFAMSEVKEGGINASSKGIIFEFILLDIIVYLKLNRFGNYWIHEWRVYFIGSIVYLLSCRLKAQIPKALSVLFLYFF